MLSTFSQTSDNVQGHIRPHFTIIKRAIYTNRLCKTVCNQVVQSSMAVKVLSISQWYFPEQIGLIRFNKEINAEMEAFDFQEYGTEDSNFQLFSFGLCIIRSWEN